MKTQDEKERDAIRRAGHRFLELRDARLWPDLAAKVEKVLAELDAFYEQGKAGGFGWRYAWQNEKDQERREGFASYFYRYYGEDWMLRGEFTRVKTAFGKYEGEAVEKEIAEFMDGRAQGFRIAKVLERNDNEVKSPYLHAHNHYQYDNSVRVWTAGKKAWMSREYTGCGNGHYYLLISPTWAVYYEKD